MFAFVLLIAVASAMDFKTWAAKHNKHYTAAEALRRRAIFNKNARFVAQHNKISKFKLSVEGPFAAMTNAEYQKFLTAFDKPEASTVEYTKTDLKASSVDWREKGMVTPVRDQGSCGSCYAFSSIAALEGRYLIAGNTKYNVNTLDLSEQAIVDCSSLNSGCNGGSLVYTYNYLANHGCATEKAYAYTEEEGTCKSFTKVVTIGGGVHVTATEAALTSALGDGPVAVCIDASGIKFQLYSGGVYDDSSCTDTINHGVTAVGYGSDGSDDYYIVKNSWGTSWGDAGYIYMSRNKNNQCAIASTCYYPSNVQDA